MASASVASLSSGLEETSNEALQVPETATPVASQQSDADFEKWKNERNSDSEEYQLFKEYLEYKEWSEYQKAQKQ